MPETNEIIPIPADPSPLTLAGHAANQAASAGLFTEYRQRCAAQTLRRQRADLALLAQFLGQAGLTVEHLDSDPASWRGISWGIVAAFVQWQLTQGYSVGSINVRLATLKTYAGLACQAGSLTPEALVLIRAVKGYSYQQSQRVDEQRAATRRGTKKASAVSLSKTQADLLKGQPDTPQGRRDALLMCLLLDHGLRCGEVARLEVAAFDLEAATFTFYRTKVAKTQTHRLTVDTYRAVTAYLTQDTPPMEVLLQGSRRGGNLSGSMSGRAINERVGVLGRAMGVVGLSPHDCRHYWATRAASQGTDPFALQEAGGWNSLAMPRRYIEAGKIANEGVKL